MATKSVDNNTLDNQPALKKDLVRMTMPMIFGVLSLMSFQLADSFFIARLGVDPLAVVGFTIPVYQLVIGLQVGIGIATTALISQRLGSANESDAKRLGASILQFGTLAVIVLCLLLWVFRENILFAMGGQANLLPLLDAFWKVFLLSALVGAVLYFGYSICRAHGDTMLPGICMVLTSLLNIALDPLYIFYFDFGLVGAAYATLTSFGLGLIFVFPKIISRHWIEFSRVSTQFKKHISEISGIAAPAMISQIMPALSAMMATYVVADYGTAAVAAWGVGVRLEFFSIVIILAMTMSLPPMIGRFYGAGDVKSIRATVSLSIRFIIAWQLILAAFLSMFSEGISWILTDAPEVASILGLFVISVPFSYAALGVCMLCISMSNAMGAPKTALLMSFLRLFACYLPCLMLGSAVAGIHGLMAGALVGNILAGLWAWHIFKGIMKKASFTFGE